MSKLLSRMSDMSDSGVDRPQDGATDRITPTDELSSFVLKLSDRMDDLTKKPLSWLLHSRQHARHIMGHYFPGLKK